MLACLAGDPCPGRSGACRRCEACGTTRSFCAAAPTASADAFGAPPTFAAAFCGSPSASAGAPCGSPTAFAGALGGSPTASAGAFCGSSIAVTAAFGGSPAAAAFGSQCRDGWICGHCSCAFCSVSFPASTGRGRARRSTGPDQCRSDGRARRSSGEARRVLRAVHPGPRGSTPAAAATPLWRQRRRLWRCQHGRRQHGRRRHE